MFWRCPTLAHEVQQVLERLLVGAAFLLGKLAGAFIQLRGHFSGFFGRTAECYQSFGQFGKLHKTVAVDVSPLRL